MAREPKRARLEVEALERREVPAVTAAVVGSVLQITGDAQKDAIAVDLSAQGDQIIVRDRGQEVGRFAAAAISEINVAAGSGSDLIRVGRRVTTPISVDGGDGQDKLIGGGGPQTLVGGNGRDLLRLGLGAAIVDAGAGPGKIIGVKDGDIMVPSPANAQPAGGFAQPAAAALPQLTEAEVEKLLERAAAVSSSEDAIIAIVDRNGRILGVRVEGGVAPEITGDPQLLTFAIDGAVAKARTAAFFANNQGPLTSRTVEFISQSTITQREVESLPFDTDPNSTGRGPGYVAPVGVGGHFPPRVPLTPQVDLFAIEHTNRDSLDNPGPDRIKGTADDILLPGRFNIDFSQPGTKLIFAPESYGAPFAANPRNATQNRGIATLPGGIPLYRTENGRFELVGGVGVFFPGKTGFATEENSSLSTTYDPTKPDRTLEAEFIAFQTVGAAPGIGFPAQTYSGIPPCPGFALPLDPANQRIDLVGVTLDIIGPGGLAGPSNLTKYGQTLQPGNPNSGTNVPVAPGEMFRAGLPVNDGWLVEPRNGVGITAEQVRQQIEQGIAQANETRAAIRLPLDSRTKMVFAVADQTGTIVGLFRMPDATVFSIDVAVAKARNAAYYADAGQLQPQDQVQGLPPGTALTARTFRYLAEPRFPEGIDGRPPGPFSILNDGGADVFTGRQVGPRLRASDFESVLGFDSFNPSTNFRANTDPANQNGVVFFPGSAPIYLGGTLIGGLGVSGDGVDQDDVVTAFATAGFKTPGALRADQFFVRGVRVPYQKFNRNPEN